MFADGTNMFCSGKNVSKLLKKANAELKKKKFPNGFPPNRGIMIRSPSIIFLAVIIDEHLNIAENIAENKVKNYFNFTLQSEEFP